MGLAIHNARTILISGPTLSGRRRLFHLLVHKAAGHPAVVATRETADSVRSRFQRVAADADAEPVVVDCITNSFGSSVGDTTTTKYAQDPANLTSIGMKYTELLTQHESDQLVVGLSNISPLVVYTSPSTVFRFVNTLIQRSIGADALVIAAIDPSVHDASTVEQFLPLFDAVVETRQSADGTQQYRTCKPEQTNWQRLSPSHLSLD